MSEMRIVTITKNHTHNGVTTYATPEGPVDIVLPKADAEWLVGAQVQAKIADRTPVEPVKPVEPVEDLQAEPLEDDAEHLV